MSSVSSASFNPVATLLLARQTLDAAKNEKDKRRAYMMSAAVGDDLTRAMKEVPVEQATPAFVREFQEIATENNALYTGIDKEMELWKKRIAACERMVDASYEEYRNAPRDGLLGFHIIKLESSIAQLKRYMDDEKEWLFGF